MSSELDFAGLQVWLRSPRVAIVMPCEGWQLHATRSLEFFSQIWGGSQGVVVPVENGKLHPAVRRLVHRYDPDYVPGLQWRLTDFEDLHPGVGQLVDDDGKPVTDPAKRQAMIELAEQNGPSLAGVAVGEEVLKSVVASLPGFREDDGYPRTYFAHPSTSPTEPLVAVPVEEDKQVKFETGDPLVDLAVGMRTGIPAIPSQVRKIADGSLSPHEVMAIVTADSALQYHAPFQATEIGLAAIGSGRFLRQQRTTVVLGPGANDFALAMLIHRTIGNCIWLPFDPDDATWRPHVAGALATAGYRSYRRELHVTSTTLDETTCAAHMGKYATPRVTTNWTYVPPSEVAVNGRVGLRLFDVWDQRFNVPVRRLPDGAAEMATTFPLLAPDDLPPGLHGWVVQAIWAGEFVHAHTALTTQDLFASDQNHYETFVRPSELGIAFESGRFDWVPSGGSKFAQLAQPKLRWPGLMGTAKRAAEDAGHLIETSYAGTLSRIAIGLWGGRDKLADDLRGAGRRLLDTFMATGTAPGPIDKGEGFDHTNTRVWVNKRCLVPFGALLEAAGTDLDPIDVRAWLDGHIAGGAIRVGLALICQTCRWADYYRIEELGTRFDCKRCGSGNVLAQARWKVPDNEPRWYYDLHPPVTTFLQNNGDVPILAVSQYAKKQRVFGVEFELEFFWAASKKAQMEIDFTFMAEHGLVLGEAKSSDSLDGKNEAERIKDAAKLFTAAAMLDAEEVCFASSRTWSVSALSAIAKAAATAVRPVTVSVLEELAADRPSSRKVLHNPAGP